MEKYPRKACETINKLDIIGYLQFKNRCIPKSWWPKVNLTPPVVPVVQSQLSAERHTTSHWGMLTSAPPAISTKPTNLLQNGLKYGVFLK